VPGDHEPSGKWIGPAALLVAAAILTWQIFVPPVVGLANNGDFGKLIGRYGLGAPSENEHWFAPTKYTFDPRYRFKSGFESSERLLVARAIRLHKLLSDSPRFDIRVMGAVHAAVFLLALALLLPVLRPIPPAQRAAILAIVIFVFCDLMYSSAYNSFYMDTGAFLFLILAAVFFLRALVRRSRLDAVAMVLCAALLVTSKTQHFLLGIPIAAFLLWKGPTLWPVRGGRWFAIASAAAVMAATVFSAKASPPDYGARGPYSVIFARILPESKDVSADLRVLGLDDSYRRYIGTHAYSPDAPMENAAFVREFQRRTSYGRLAWFWATHPARAWESLRFSLSGAGRQRANLGNFDSSTGVAPFTESYRFAAWSSLKRRIFYEHGTLYLIYFVVLAAVCVVSLRRRPPLGQAVWLLVSMALLEMLVASLADAIDWIRHFYLYTALLDLLLVAGIAAALSGYSRDKVRSRS
jgi:hypothetical protein